jgi:transposase-like protein
MGCIICPDQGRQFKEKQELERLRKKLAEAEEELEVIKKATAYFAQERLKRNTPGSKK